MENITPGGLLTSAPVTTGDKDSAFGTHHDWMGVGGWRAVATLADRNALGVTERLETSFSSGRRRRWMRVLCGDTLKEFALLISDSAWAGAATDAAKIALLANNNNWVEITKADLVNGAIPAAQLPDPSWGLLKKSATDPQTINAAINAAVLALINGAPGALDALNELAAALGNDPNFATTVTNSLALKAATTYVDASDQVLNQRISDTLVWVYLGNRADKNIAWGTQTGNIYGTAHAGNTYGNEHFTNTYGNDHQINTYGGGHGNNIYGIAHAYNRYGGSHAANTYGFGSQSNTFGSRHARNKYGNALFSNTFADNQTDNIYGNTLQNSYVGPGCCRITVGDNCTGLEIYNCDSITIPSNTVNAVYRNNVRVNTPLSLVNTDGLPETATNPYFTAARKAAALARANHTGFQSVSTISDIAAVAVSGSYADLLNTPAIPTGADVNQGPWNPNTNTPALLAIPGSGATGRYYNISESNRGFRTTTTAAASTTSLPVANVNYAIVGQTITGPGIPANVTIVMVQQTGVNRFTTGMAAGTLFLSQAVTVASGSTVFGTFPFAGLSALPQNGQLYYNGVSGRWQVRRNSALDTPDVNRGLWDPTINNPTLPDGTGYMPEDVVGSYYTVDRDFPVITATVTTAPTNGYNFVVNSVVGIFRAMYFDAPGLVRNAIQDFTAATREIVSADFLGVPLPVGTVITFSQGWFATLGATSFKKGDRLRATRAGWVLEPAPLTVLYTSAGQATDGPMTQKATTDVSNDLQSQIFINNSNISSINNRYETIIRPKLLKNVYAGVVNRPADNGSFTLTADTTLTTEPYLSFKPGQFVKLTSASGQVPGTILSYDYFAGTVRVAFSVGGGFPSLNCSLVLNPAGGLLETYSTTGLTRSLTSADPVVTAISILENRVNRGAPGEVFAVLPYGTGTVVVDFSAPRVQTLAATGNVTYGVSLNVSLLKTAEHYITNTTTGPITLIFPTGWDFSPFTAPTSLAAGKLLTLKLRALGATDGSVKAFYSPDVAGSIAANDANVVHRTGTETIGGAKTFTSLTTISGDTDGSAIGPLVVKATGANNTVGTALTMDGSTVGGKKYSFIATGTTAGIGGGLFAVFNGTDNRYVWSVDGLGNQFVPGNFAVNGAITTKTAYGFADNSVQTTAALNTTYYVSSAGSDTGNGRSPATAWATVAKVNAFALVAGDIVLFEGGKSFVGPLLIKGGIAGFPITYGSYGGRNAIIVGDNINAIVIKDVSNVVITGLDAKGINQTPGNNYGIYFDSTAGWVENILVTRCRAYGFGHSGISSYPSAAAYAFRNIEITYCEMYENARNGLWWLGSYSVAAVPRISTVNIRYCKAYDNKGIATSTGQHSGSGIIVSGLVDSVVEGCEAFNNGGLNGHSGGGPVGIFMFECLRQTFRYCHSHHNRSGDAGATRQDGGGFDIDGGCDFCVIEYCYSHDNWGAGFAFYEYGATNLSFTNNVIRYNVSWNDAMAGDVSEGAISIWSVRAGNDNCSIHNNLVYISSRTRISGTRGVLNFFTGSMAFNNLQIFNNIFIADGPTSNMRCNTNAFGTFATNIYYAPNGGVLNLTTGGITTDPQLMTTPVVAPMASEMTMPNWRGQLSDYHVIPGSPAINAGSVPTGFVMPLQDFFSNRIIGIVNIGPHEQL